MSGLFPALRCEDFGTILSVQVDAQLISLVLGSVQQIAWPGQFEGDPEDVICTAFALQDFLNALMEGQPPVSVAYPVQAKMFHDDALVLHGAALTAHSIDNTQAWCFRAFQSTSAQNDEWQQQYILKAGTYTLFMNGVTGAGRGILTVSIDGVSQGTIDWYENPGGANRDKTLTVTVVGDGLHVLNGKVATKNASSTGYQMFLSSYALR